ncbi:MAG: tRNA (adenosine(37)-N6)-dimethylallyltransferase MiaA [Bacteroidales bacterium]|nr:tRNA (adenosine(37)-N6)-dimethylallyltransferase MiaA [Bacteroidales bacterium]MDY4521863.1 tRNA (adenosine(37)-N6)-dimethylallyltransferase MiaA [Bacteroidales bacterium]
METNKRRLTAIVGPTACGKTELAAHLAAATNGEILSADSRQVYRGMDIGTGKDLADYVVDGKQIPYHLIDIADPGEKYNVYRFQTDFAEAYEDVISRAKHPIMCGGSGLYAEAVLKNYSLLSVPPNPTLRQELERMSEAQLAERLSSLQQLHNVTDLDNKRRTIRAIEIAEYLKEHAEETGPTEGIEATVIGISVPRDVRRERITRRLRTRLREGLIEEIQSLLDKGIAVEDLIYYGLEYKYVTMHCIGELTYEEMFTQLEIAIHQFAKRQMTWFRGMERRGTMIHWIDGMKPMEEKIAEIVKIIGGKGS